jgi:hypothetical protein
LERSFTLSRPADSKETDLLNLGVIKDLRKRFPWLVDQTGLKTARVFFYVLFAVYRRRLTKAHAQSRIVAVSDIEASRAERYFRHLDNTVVVESILLDLESLYDDVLADIEAMNAYRADNPSTHAECLAMFRKTSCALFNAIRLQRPGRTDMPCPLAPRAGIVADISEHPRWETRGSA